MEADNISENDVNDMSEDGVSEEYSEDYYNQGIMEYEEEKYEQAIENFKKAIEIDDSVFDYHYNLGLAYIRIEKYDLAIESFKKGLAINSKDADIYLNLGLAFYNTGEFGKAVAAYKKAISNNSNDPDSYSNAGIAYCALKNYKEAIFYFKQAVKMEPKNSTYNFNLAYVHFEAGNYDFAEEYLIKVLTLDRQNEEAYFLLGKVCLKQYDKPMAKVNFEKVLSINPDHKEAQEALEELNSKTPSKSSDKVKNVPETIAKNEEENKVPLSNLEIQAENYFDIAKKHMERKEYEAAIIELKKTLTLVSDHSNALKSMSTILKILKETDELFNKGVNCFSKNDFASSISHLEKALSIYPNEKTKKLLNEVKSKNAEKQLTIGNKYIEQEEYDVALDVLRDTLHLDSNNKETKDAVYHVINELNTCHNEIADYIKECNDCIEKQEYANAVNSIKKVFDINPDNLEAKALLVKVIELQNKSK